MEQNKSKSSACRLLGPLATNTSMDFGVLLLRLGVAVMMLVHGIPKLGMLISGNWAAFQDPLGIGNFLSLLLCVGAEFGCSVLLPASPRAAAGRERRPHPSGRPYPDY